MTRATVRPSMAWLVVVALLLTGATVACGEEESSAQAQSAAQEQAAAQGQSPAQEPRAAQEQSGAQVSPAVEDEVQEDVDQKLAERRKAMMKEAHAALDETNAALRALDDGKTDEALDALARATGKLELLVARDPELALAPVDVDVVTHDIYGTPEAIRGARDRAAELLEDGEVQEARALLSGLASEIVIVVTNLPLATYPAAIKEISPLIDDGHIEEAKTALRAVLDTLVVTQQSIALPVLRARAMLDEAETLVAKDDPSEADEERIAELVKDAREQLEMAELLGYGEEEEHETFREQIAELQKKIRSDEETGGIFARLRKSLDGFQESSFVE